MASATGHHLSRRRRLLRDGAGRELSDVHDKPVRLPDPERLAIRRDRRRARREVVVFHSSAEAMHEFVPDLPFTAIADPGKDLYREFARVLATAATPTISGRWTNCWT
jgi:hypothetical protein